MSPRSSRPLIRRLFLSNQGEIVKRILYLNPEAEFIFCAGDDKVRCTISSIVD